MNRLLIANRGEIAVRIIRAARDLGIETVAVYSDVDRGALHVRLADHKVALLGSHARETYLDCDKLVSAAIQSGADAVHPGYGFFSENATFAQRVCEAGLCFVGPTPETIALMAAKDEARRRVASFGVPLVPGSDAIVDEKEALRIAAKIGYPVLVKAAAGGGGRGMRVVEGAEQLVQRLEEARREAEAAFGNDAVFIEKFIAEPRHIEVQVFGDRFGNLLHLWERECSVQRRHQKLVEESPAPNLHPELRTKILTAALLAAQSVNYLGAGTVEFLVDGGGKTRNSPFYFLEMNTRIQVEHPVTEMVTGTDLVKLQLQVARNEPLPFGQEDVEIQGHAIEYRVYAEDPQAAFAPTAGKIRYLSRSFGPGVREDSWVEAGTKVSTWYDSLLSKLIVYGTTREDALARSKRALDEYLIEGVPTTLEFHRWLLREPDFIRGMVDVRWIDRHYSGETRGPSVVGPLSLGEPIESQTAAPSSRGKELRR